MYNYTWSRLRGSEELLEICRLTGPMATVGSERTYFLFKPFEGRKESCFERELPGVTACYHMKECFITQVQWAEH